MSKTHNKIKAVIFDMDGVISDTQMFHAQAESETLKTFNIYLTPQELSTRYAGIPDQIMFRQILRRFNKQADVNEIIKKKWPIMNRIVKNNIQPIPGVQDFVKELHKRDFLLAVASASPTHFIKTILDALHIKNLFQAIVSGDEVQRGKPHPDLFFLAAKKLGVKPTSCLVIEDSTNGVKATKNAGMKCIGIITTHNRSDLKEADLVVDSFDELTVERVNNL